MKKLPLIINAILIIAVAILYVLHFFPKKSSTPFLAEGSTVSASDGIVYINIDSVLTNYKMHSDIMAELQDKLSTKEAELQSKQRRFEKGVSDYQNKINKGLVTRTEAAEIEKDLQTEQQTLMQLQQKMQYTVRI